MKSPRVIKPAKIFLKNFKNPVENDAPESLYIQTPFSTLSEGE